MTLRHKSASSRWFFVALAAIVLFLSWKIVEPLAIVLAAGAIAAVIFAPVDARMHRHILNRKVSAFVTVVAGFLGILIPLFVIGVLMVQQAAELVQTSVSEGGWLRTFDIRENPLFLLLPEIVRDHLLAIDIIEAGKSGIQWLFDRLGGFFSQTAGFVFKVFFFLIATYYFLSEREHISKMFQELSPLRDKVDRDIMQRIVGTVRGVVFGALIVAAVQAALATIGLALFGVPGALLWGSLIILAAQVPLVGVGLVMVPAVAYLLITGSTGAAIGLAVWGAVAVGLVDNLISPYIVGGRTKLHAFLILIAILGGLQFFGAIGIVLGPTVLAALLVVIDLYKHGALEGK